MIRKILFPLLFSCVLIACDDNDENATPSPASENGTVTGKISGTSIDGTDFSENFQLSLSPTPPFVIESSGAQTLFFQAGNGQAGLMTQDIGFNKVGDTFTGLRLNTFIFSFYQELSPNKMLHIESVMNNTHYTAKLAIADEKNNLYKINYSLYPEVTNLLIVMNNQVPVPELADENTHTLFFAEDARYELYFSSIYQYDETHDIYYAPFKGIRDRKTGTFSTTSNLYQNLKITLTDFHGANSTVFLDENFNDLSGELDVLPDQFEIRNFKFDEDAGKITYDYTVTQYGHPYAFFAYISNSTRHTLTIEGTVETKAYQEIK